MRARYADTNGYEKDDRRSIWPYRDRAHPSLQRQHDLRPFHSGTVRWRSLPDAGDDQRIATGFHRNTMVNTEGGTDDEEFRVAAVVDRVNTTMEVWMGTTMACAQCHNHKYDPFSIKDYYSLYAIFNNTTDPGRANTPTLELMTPQEKLKRLLLQGSIEALASHPNGNWGGWPDRSRRRGSTRACRTHGRAVGYSSGEYVGYARVTPAP
jgi:hypothetical protein